MKKKTADTIDGATPSPSDENGGSTQIPEAPAAGDATSTSTADAGVRDEGDQVVLVHISAAREGDRRLVRALPRGDMMNAVVADRQIPGDKLAGITTCSF